MLTLAKGAQMFAPSLFHVPGRSYINLAIMLVPNLINANNDHDFTLTNARVPVSRDVELDIHWNAHIHRMVKLRLSESY